MSAGTPLVDVNLFVRNGAATVAAAIDSVLAQTWPNLTLTVFDNGSTDATPDILRDYAGRVAVHRVRTDAGAVLNCQRAFWHGGADYVMPKTADDLLAPEFIAQVMAVLLAHPDCVMCHAAGLMFDGPGIVRGQYPASQNLHAVSPDPRERACGIMRSYTSAPAFWGIYRRDAVDRLARIPYRAGWDHVVLAELALYGEIRHVPETLFWRRDGGKANAILARGCSQFAQRGLPLDDELAELGWRTPMITTAFAHVEAFAMARLDAAERLTLMQDAGAIFRRRWGAQMLHEARRFRADLPERIGVLAAASGLAAQWIALQLTQAVRAIETILPEQDFTEAHLEIAALAGVGGGATACCQPMAATA